MTFKCIRYFISGYFHQDWYIYGSTDKEIIKYFIQKESLVQVNTLVSELENLSALDIDNNLAEKILIESGCGYYYQADSLSALEWLLNIKYLLKITLDEHLS
ncbi:contact-dependent growth inhibition system immunity protein [Vibrio sagamiensis]|uniref:CdiI immunity protein domain-containing protein n=1 Tax=Vibrio sagamiensis NBRC 104589 TaxID=1219064 RepID=A0A511QHK5_9VIBR|nr:contact-dependent growth inhibition system immunity protein [Vibrio sagamiensis]PNQ53918.1 hypothetical protein C1141_18665 [Vibrio agarivorans]GEM76667.1 hypothetical protein VSA01S_27790 [Vibrio sagamiensis NBRC 104589]